MVVQPETADRALEQVASVFRLLSDRTRLHILLLLAKGEQNVSSLCSRLQLPQPTVSHHLGLLRTSHVITNRRSGKQVYYALLSGVDLGHEASVRIDVDQVAMQIVSHIPLREEGVTPSGPVPFSDQP